MSFSCPYLDPHPPHVIEEEKWRPACMCWAMKVWQGDFECMAYYMWICDIYWWWKMGEDSRTDSNISVVKRALYSFWHFVLVRNIDTRSGPNPTKPNQTLQTQIPSYLNIWEPKLVCGSPNSNPSFLFYEMGPVGSWVSKKNRVKKWVFSCGKRSS